MRIPLPVLPLPFLFLLSMGCAQDHALDLSPENQDSTTVAAMAGTWCSDTSNRYEQLELSPPSTSQRRDEGTFRAIGPILHSVDVSISPTRLIQSGTYFAFQGVLQFKVQEERLWSDATGKIADTFETVDRTVDWNYRMYAEWSEALDRIIYGLDLDTADSETQVFDLSHYSHCALDLGE